MIPTMRNNLVSCKKGAAALEFAIVLPLIVLLMGGIIEFGIVLYDQHVINNATREGARAAINPIPTKLSESAIVTIVKNYCKENIGGKEEQLTITFGNSDALAVNVVGAQGNKGNDVIVTATYTYQFLLPKIITLGDTIQLKSTTTMKMM
jgi:Flp pilus assembly protein TadG